MTPDEKEALVSCESSFLEKNINDALCDVIRWFVKNDPQDGSIVESMKSIIDFLSEGSNLLNELDDSVYNELVRNGYSDGIFLRIKHRPKIINNSNMTVCYILYDYKLEELNLPEVKVATPSACIVTPESAYTLKSINLPKLESVYSQFDCISQAFTNKSPVVIKVNAKAYDIINSNIANNISVKIADNMRVIWKG